MQDMTHSAGFFVEKLLMVFITPLKYLSRVHTPILKSQGFLCQCQQAKTQRLVPETLSRFPCLFLPWKS